MVHLSKELEAAIGRLFENKEIGYSALGVTHSEEMNALGLRTERTVPENVSAEERISLLRRKLEDWVELKSAEIQEYDSVEDTTRIRAEALSTLMFLRDLNQYFPRVQTATREAFEKHRRSL
ncbi:hypothetical protein ROS1_17930 [Roseibium sp. ROS1]|jgi:hypothetical protein|uniref:hypothetical protein n=1 Tax=Labrenzia sp. R5_0 TaxID=2821108 RepID=UPI001ADD240E|nr:hypothetical protein [Labrenzia sp. R5_0]MBO9458102.1 hypothetical protein [Labrenzia sp. R5_0]